MATPKPVSWAPEDQESGGGLFDDGAATVVKARVVRWNYRGKAAPVAALYVQLDAGLEKPVEEYYKAADLKAMAPSITGIPGDQTEGEAEGFFLVAVDGKDHVGINDQATAAYFMQHLGNTGFKSETLAAGDVRGLEGHTFHFKRVRRQVMGKDQDPLVPTRYIGVAAGANKSASKSGNGATSTDDVKSKVTDVVIEVLSEKPEGITRAALSQELAKRLEKDPAKGQALKVLLSEGFLKSDPFAYDGKLVTLAA